MPTVSKPNSHYNLRKQSEDSRTQKQASPDIPVSIDKCGGENYMEAINFNQHSIIQLFHGRFEYGDEYEYEYATTSTTFVIVYIFLLDGSNMVWNIIGNFFHLHTDICDLYLILIMHRYYLCDRLYLGIAGVDPCILLIFAMKLLILCSVTNRRKY